MSLYSIARFQFTRPKAPFLLGGWFYREGEDCYLVDARARVRLRGDSSLFTSLRDGDLVQVEVRSVSQDSVDCDKAERVSSPRREPRLKAAPHAHEFVRFLAMIREFFARRGMTELITPTLVTCPGLEPTLEPFAVPIAKGREKGTAYLPTSPEISLKKAISAGWTDIFEIKTCFRAGEFSPHHENEFHMLEWYRGFAGLDAILTDLKDLLEECARRGFASEGAVPRLTTFKELFREILDFDLKPSTTIAELRALCEKEGIHAPENDGFNDLFHRLLIEKIEPRFASRGALIVRDFPPSMAALARLTPEGFADRFEFYWNGLEIANAFNEVTDPEEQRRRWRAEQDERLHLGTADLPQDPALIEALQRGIPPTGGVALGVERLYMACRGVNEIRLLKLFTSDDLFS